MTEYGIIYSLNLFQGAWQNHTLHRDLTDLRSKQSKGSYSTGKHVRDENLI